MKAVALIGAGGKMGGRIADNLCSHAGYEMRYCEVAEAGVQALEEKGLRVVPAVEAVTHADMVILAVPDAAMRVVSAQIVPLAEAGSTLILLDPAAAMAGEVELRDDLNYVVTHPCHPPLFGDEESREARGDFFGGVAARQDIVSALMQGTEEAFTAADELCRAMFAPVVTSHRITVEQMAILEPAMAEVCAACAATLMKEALDEAIKAGVPEAAARSFMMGHAQIPLAIVFGAISSPFSDAARIAVEYGKRHILQNDWRRVLEPEHVQACIREMLHPEARPG